ncbi:alginate export family protein [Colwellia echini]|uniref:Alginate export domain-containing protein n=1 Tax=Colwellia echini TaxID=1982103 RepID=A0ABY3MYN0_9GAMM|nr:alginate export family protein [Colwellia echini]TYK66304.1 hypothetical protein CWS31_006840 [Colwellia echini]
MTLNKIALCLAIAFTGTNSTMAFAEDVQAATVVMAEETSSDTVIIAEEVQLVKTNNTIAEAVLAGKASIDLNLRYEGVEQENDLKNANALTLRTRLSYQTGVIAGFSSFVEFEDSRVVFGVDEYNNTLGKNTDYSTVADPETTEFDQFLLQYKYKDITIKTGRMVMVFDDQRFVGHVGWRQDRQTFDGSTFEYQPIDALTLNYNHINKRNRIFAEARDIESDDNLFHVAYKTSVGTIKAYAYLLEVDNDTENGLDTYGIRFSGGTTAGDQKITYQLEYAQQESNNLGVKYDADYILAEVGTSFSAVGVKLGFEQLGSDGGNYGFSTPLATLHKFNGWSDQFLNTPNQGIQDLYAGINGKLFEGKWALIYHNFGVDVESNGVDDLGSEIDAVYTKNFAKNYTAGIKLAAYSAGDLASGKVDTNKVWIWLNAKF